MISFYAAGKLESISLNFDQAFTYAKPDVCVEIPLGHENPDNTHVLTLKSNVCGLIDANLTCHDHCAKGLQDRGFTRPNVDTRLF